MRSMTGYAKLIYEDEKYALQMEMKSVNNKNLSCKIKLPYNLNFLETKIRNEIAAKVLRGSVELRIELEEKEENLEAIQYDKNLSRAYFDTLSSMEKELGEVFSNKMDFLVRNFNVLKKGNNEVSEEEYSQFLLPKVQELLLPFLESRQEEGNRLQLFFLEKFEILKSYVTKIEEYQPSVVERYKEKLLARLQTCREDLHFEENDILKEVMIFTDRSDISEELSRLKSHLQQLEKELKSKELGLGKKIEFLLQEIFRELNTTGVKSNLYEISNLVVSAKNELEKIREQIMNIE
ncbi:YicC/YloC family endoribonuclease [Fusobacterium gonidiaformans]|uniref:YicC/YloC family endoribonuclease n=1 Tax=Fusobacterium gonidiaformans TaxID=849 RepID=UPI0001BC6695|nr:YicC/YloC family endoribonuclease [Fusobacterium gonidiaformans]AVQ16205.1 YicC family protein [Fusobacterium gonidiaformans ATCC 25563]EFS28576.1 TIGR00255 family protein [Fusobacterium gonidiaformans ATCC 25563]